MTVIDREDLAKVAEAFDRRKAELKTLGPRGEIRIMLDEARERLTSAQVRGVELGVPPAEIVMDSCGAIAAMVANLAASISEPQTPGRPTEAEIRRASETVFGVIQMVFAQLAADFAKKAIELRQHEGRLS